MKTGLLRNLEQIQETEGRPRRTRAGTLVLAALGGACVIFAVASQARQKAPRAPRATDPLAELVAQAKSAPPPHGAELGGGDVTFPSMLSDDLRTTTALAAVRPGAPGGASSATRSGAGAAAARLPDPKVAPPPPTDRLAVVPLPAKNIAGASPWVSRPRDVLTQMAKEASSVTTPPVGEGRAGGYQLQTSSFRSEEEASLFATALRQRGHRAYVEPAHVSGRGTWFRVRIGPFRSQKDASNYRSEFEQRERLVPFIVEPPKEKAQSPKGP